VVRFYHKIFNNKSLLKIYKHIYILIKVFIMNFRSKRINYLSSFSFKKTDPVTESILKMERDAGLLAACKL
jgi:hypothetical protein